MDFLNNISEKTLLICNQSTKNLVLKKLNTLDKLLDLKIMNPYEFLKHYFFSYDEETIYYLTKNYNIKREIAIIYLENIKYIIETDLDNNKVKFLQGIYHDLQTKNLLKYDKLFQEYLNKVNILVLNKEQLEPFLIDILNKYQTKYIDIFRKKRLNNLVYSFKTIEEEVAYNFNSISSLIKSGINYQNIKVILLGDEYIPYIKRFSYFYNIPFNNLEKNSIYATNTTTKFLTLIKTLTKEELFDFLINSDLEYKEEYLNIINRYYFIDDLNDVYDFIILDLKNIYIEESYNEFAIDIIPLDSNLVSDLDYVFVLGFNIENIPKTYKDIDYFNDSLKSKLGLFTSSLKNNLVKSQAILSINNIKNIQISLKENDPYNSFYPSNLIEEMSLEIIDNIDSLNITSNLYNKIKLTEELDLSLKYQTTFKDMDSLINTYDIPYLTYSNHFSKLNNFTLPKIILSYTSLNTYYHCSFKYYIENILKLNIFNDSFKQFIGTLFHYILSKMYNDDFNFEDEWRFYLTKRELTKKELFYLQDLKNDLKSIIEVLKYQYHLTGLTNLKLENEIVLNYTSRYLFKGIIDKIMYKEKDDNTYIALIDYKTGLPKINIDNIKYGLDMQLAIYAYLTTHSNLFKNPKIIGFYLEKIILEGSLYNQNKDSQKTLLESLKLQGYSINSEYLVSMFDPTYENSEMIKGMKMTSNGFSRYTKILTDSEINNMLNLVDAKIKEAFKLIDSGDFSINPKVIKGENRGCEFCKYKDLCFVTGENLVYLKGD